MQQHNGKDILKFYNRNEISNHDFLIFELLIIEVCNLHCSYCYMRNDSPTWESLYTKKNVLKVIDQLSKMNKPVSICLSGGEASLNPHFMMYIKILTELIADPNSAIRDLHINTNLRLSIDKINEIKAINPKTIYHISYHSSDATPHQDFVDKLLAIDADKRELNIMLHPKKSELEKVDEFIQLCEKNELRFYVKPVYINDHYKPTKNILEVIKRYANSATKEYVVETETETVRMNDWDLYDNKLIPLDTEGYNCKYTFFTLDGNGNIKQMCGLFDIKNIFDDFQFFQDYDMDKGIICPFKSKCLWASSLDHLKIKV